MDLSIFLSWQMIAFALLVVAFTHIIRQVVDYFDLENKKWWKEGLLPILPILTGLACAILFPFFPYPPALSNFGNREIFGAIAGLLSSVVYRAVKGAFKKVNE